MTETSVSGCSEEQSLQESSTSEPPDEIEYIKAVVRCCSMKDRELASFQESILKTDTDQGIVTVTNSILPGSTPISKKTFTFDGVYDWILVKQGNQDFHDALCAKQGDFYDSAIKDIVDSVLQGYNGTVFAYGQTGAGKTTTIQGVRDNHDLRGVIPRSCEHIFSHVSQSTNQQYLIYVSYLQIYQEQMMDLLSPDSLHSCPEIKEHPETGVYVKNLTSVAVKNMTEMERLWNAGNGNKDRWITHMSMQSSRVHYIFTVTVECCEVNDDGEKHVRVGRLNLVDMAGSERQSKTEANEAKLKEATSISLSISPLGSVISALIDEKSKYVPYRNSKLTRLLKDSLGGTAKTVMVACISPASSNYNETISSLRYADRARNIKNRPKVNVDPKYALLLKYQEEIDRLKAELRDTTKSSAGRRSENSNEDSNSGIDNDQDLGTEGVTTATKQKDEDASPLEKGTQETKKAENDIKYGTLDRDVLAAKIQGMDSRILTGGASTEQHVPLEDAQLLEVLNSDTQRLFICQNLTGT